jgi:hypothetical protein
MNKDTFIWSSNQWKLVDTLGAVASILALVIYLLSQATCTNSTKTPVFRGETGIPGMDDERLSDFLNANSGGVVALEITVPKSDFVSGPQRLSNTVVFEIGNSMQGWEELIEITAPEGADFYLGEWHNGDVEIRGTFKMMGQAGLGTGLATTKLLALSPSDVAVLTESER